MSRYKLYRDGAYGYAYNPNTRLWEVYNLTNDEPHDLICSLQRPALCLEAIKNLKDLDRAREELKQRSA